MKKLYVKSYGCQMNVYDGQRMADTLAPEGFVETQDIAQADIVVLNTCNIREKAADRVYSTLGRVREIKEARTKNGKDTAIVVAGCVAQAEGAEIQRRNPAVDLVIGPQNYHRLPQLVKQARGRRIVDTEFPPEDKFDHLPAPSKAVTARRGVTAFVTVQEGCDKFCAFCVVPYTRGTEVSRPVARIVEEVRRLAEAGVREVTLIGQNVNAYHGTGPDGASWSLARLMQAVADIDGIARIRYMTSHPNDMGEDLIAAHRDLPQLMPFLHLPVQSGSDKILKAMNRRHDANSYLKVIECVKSMRPDIAVSSDFIVGFPGETDADFEATLQLVDAVGFAMAYSFKYSTRPGTPAADSIHQVPEEVMVERLTRLQERLEHHRLIIQQAMVGKRLPVLLERNGKHAGQLAGKTPCFQAVQIETETVQGINHGKASDQIIASPCRIGDIVMVDIVSCGTFSLFGERVPTALAA